MNAVLNVLLEITVYSAVLYGVILLFQKVFHKQLSAALHYALWALLILRLLIPVTFDGGLRFFILPENSAQVIHTDLAAPSVYEKPDFALSSQQPANTVPFQSGTSKKTNNPFEDHAKKPTVPLKIDWQTALLLLLGAGVLVSFIFLAVLCWRLRRKIQRCATDAPEYALNLVDACKKDMGIRANIQVSVQDWLKSPALSSSLKPMLLLPADMINAANIRQLEFGILHELTHYRRRDYLVNLLLMVLRCVYWFNPVVYFAFRRVQVDMETACDADITACMEKQQRIDYIRTMIDLSGSSQIQCVLGMGMCKGRKAMEKRVRGIFMKKKAGPAVRMAVALLAGFMLLACFTTACQPTPEKPAVIQKNTEQMVKKAQETFSKVQDNRRLQEQLNVPKTLTAELTSEKGKLKIHADAKIIVPGVAALPTVRVGMGAFTSDDVQRLYKTLIGDAMPIDAENTPETRAQRMRIVQGLLEQKKAGKLDKYESMAELDAAIKEVMKDASVLPEHFERAEPDFSYKELGDGAKEVHLRAAPDDATVSDLRILNAAEGSGFSRVEYYRDLNYAASLSGVGSFSFNQTESPYFKPPAMSEDAARKLAEDTVAALELKDFVLSGQRINALFNITADADDAPRIGVYEYMFTRQFGGVPLTYTNDEGNSSSGGKDAAPAYAAPWLYEKVWIVIDDKGILYFEWDSPYDVLKTVTNASAMMPFEDIRKIFEKNIPVVNNRYDTSERNWTCDMYVTEVRLGLMRVFEKNTGKTGLIVPVWDFMGYTKDSQNFVNGRDGYEALLTVNAIDGSIINRGLGY